MFHFICHAAKESHRSCSVGLEKKVGYVRNIVCAGVQSIAKTNGKEVGSASMPMTRLRANSSYSRVRGHLLFSFPFSFDIFRFCPSPLSQAAEGQAPNAQ